MEDTDLREKQATVNIKEAHKKQQSLTLSMSSAAHFAFHDAAPLATPSMALRHASSDEGGSSDCERQARVTRQSRERLGSSSEDSLAQSTGRRRKHSGFTGLNARIRLPVRNFDTGEKNYNYFLMRRYFSTFIPVCSNLIAFCLFSYFSSLGGSVVSIILSDPSLPAGGGTRTPTGPRAAG